MMIASPRIASEWHKIKEEVFESYEDNYFECCLAVNCQTGCLTYVPSDESLHCVETAGQDAVQIDDSVNETGALESQLTSVDNAVEAQRPKSRSLWLQQLVQNDGHFLHFAKFDKNFRIDEDIIEDKSEFKFDRNIACETPDVRSPKIVVLKNVNPDFQECSSCSSSLLVGEGIETKESSCVTVASFYDSDDKPPVDKTLHILKSQDEGRNGLDSVNDAKVDGASPSRESSDKCQTAASMDDFTSVETHASCQGEVRTTEDQNVPRGPELILEPKTNRENCETSRVEYDEFSPAVYNSSRNVRKGMKATSLYKPTRKKCRALKDQRKGQFSDNISPPVAESGSPRPPFHLKNCPSYRSSDYERFARRTARHLKMRLEGGSYIVYSESRHRQSHGRWRRRRTLWSLLTENAFRFLSLVLAGKPTTRLSPSQFRRNTKKRKSFN